MDDKHKYKPTSKFKWDRHVPVIHLESKNFEGGIPKDATYGCFEQRPSDLPSRKDENGKGFSYYFFYGTDFCEPIAVTKCWVY